MQIGEITDMVMSEMLTFVPSNLYHSANAITDCKVVTVLSPQKIYKKRNNKNANDGCAITFGKF